VDIGEFLAMGGYARFVWPAYGLSAIVLAYNAWSAVRLGRHELASALRRSSFARADAR
jgi:heme exporter protein CcmD